MTTVLKADILISAGLILNAKAETAIEVVISACAEKSTRGSADKLTLVNADNTAPLMSSASIVRLKSDCRFVCPERTTADDADNVKSELSVAKALLILKVVVVNVAV